MNPAPHSSGPPPSVASPMLRRWLTRGKRDLDPWLAAMNGIALTFLLTAMAGGGARDINPPPVTLSPQTDEPLESVSMEFAAPALTAESAPADALTPPETPESSEFEPVPDIPEAPPWREAPEMIDPVAFVEPALAPAPLPTPKATKETRPAPARSSSSSSNPNARPRPASPASATGSLTGAASSGNAAPAARTSSGTGRGTTPQPPYPAFARRDKLQGTVVVSISVVNGTVSNVSIVSGSGSASLDAYAVGHVRKRWKWPPGTTTTYTQPFRFVLK